MKFNQMTLYKFPFLLACLVLLAESIGLFILPAYIKQNLPSILCGRSGNLINDYIVNHQEPLSTIANYMYVFALILFILSLSCIWSVCSIKRNIKNETLENDVVRS